MTYRIQTLHGEIREVEKMSYGYRLTYLRKSSSVPCGESQYIYIKLCLTDAEWFAEIVEQDTMKRLFGEVAQ